MVKIIECDKCKNKFKYSIKFDTFPGGMDKEELSCPYCGNLVCEIMTSGIIKTEKIKP